MKRKILTSLIGFRASEDLRRELRIQADNRSCHESDICRRAVSKFLSDLRSEDMYPRQFPAGDCR